MCSGDGRRVHRNVRTGSHGPLVMGNGRTGKGDIAALTVHAICCHATSDSTGVRNGVLHSSGHVPSGRSKAANVQRISDQGRILCAVGMTGNGNVVRCAQLHVFRLHHTTDVNVAIHINGGDLGAAHPSGHVDA